ncbi:MAG TPA: signal peptidase I [Anaerolineae bacterium]|nr:signal peptidase I [Anaerolineae bacterium]
MAQRFWSTLSEFVVLVLIAFVLAMGIRTAVAEVRWVPTGSMEPTIKPGDRLFTVKLNYYFKEPARGDIVVFNVPPQVKREQNMPPFVKRVIGLPGDTVEVRGGKVYVNGKVFNVGTARTPEYDYPPVKVEDGMLFVLGDNRNHSYDSHEWGLLPEDNVIAKAVLIIWPLDHAHVLK